MISVQSKIYSFIFMCGTVMFLCCLRRVKASYLFAVHDLQSSQPAKKEKGKSTLFFLPKLDKRVIINSSTLLGQLSKAPVTVKPLSPKSDQHQLSRCNITAL